MISPEVSATRKKSGGDPRSIDAGALEPGFREIDAGQIGGAKVQPLKSISAASSPR